ncbi:MAG: MerR family transcriptional regulator [Planctomycetes bacterium]|nr:MerR family transcriptional regulator [Planctomycetota bacterium]
MAKYRLSQVAKLIDVAPITLKRWLLSGRINEVQRDRNGWRVFTDEDVSRIQTYAATLYPPCNDSNPSLFRPGMGTARNEGRTR